ncbi:hypothetical protein ACEWY4_027662 [Coilia grayii]|uniref:Ig-like domain-containing protein n=1 Tax=Coilia grayii TaxID=363190 RepID=A0ABD1IR85_9TELE
MDRNRFFLTSYGALYISEVQKEDALSTYRCITKHKYSGETRQSNGARLSVLDPTESPPSVLDSFQAGEVQVGRSVELPCAASGYPNPTIRWLKDGRPLPSDSRWSRHLTGLTVSDLRLEDSGNYICEVTNSFGSKEVTGHLNVIEPLRVTLSPKNLKTGISSTVILSCAVQGSPHYTVSWFRNTEPVLPDQHFSIQGAHNETLFITAAQKRHSGAYQCFATRKGQTAQDFSIILLEDGTPRIVSSFSERVVAPGEPFSLMCAAKGAPPPTISWTLDDEAIARDSALRASQYTLSDGSTVSHVNVSNPQIRDGGVYRCVARNSAGSAEYQARINVRGPPSIRAMRNITAVAGRNTFINCRVIGYPYYSIKWYKDGMQLPDNHRQIVYENGTLKLSDVQKGMDEGAYLCSVLISPQVFITQTVYVTVKVPPLIQPFDFPPTSIGKLMYVACVVSSGDMPIRFTWRKDGQDIVPGGNSGVTIETKEFMSSLQISKVSLKHNGNYTCIASNDAATVSTERQLIVTVPPRFEVQPNNQDGIYGKSGILNCSVDGYPPPKVMWKHAKGNPQQYHPVPLTGRIQLMSNGSLLIRHVLEEDRGYYLCQASNGVGSDISKSMMLTVKIPAMITSHPNTTMAIKGQNKELNCTARGEWPIIIRWERGDTVIDPDRNPRYSITTSPNEKSDEVVSTLKLMPAERGDSVFFSCHAINSYGEGRGLIQLTVQTGQICWSLCHQTADLWRSVFLSQKADPVQALARSKPGRSAGHFAIRRQICGGPNRADLLVTLPSDGRSVEVSLSLTEGRSRAGTRKVRSKPGRSAGHFAIRRQICGGPNRADLLVTLPSDGRSVEVSLSLTEGRSRAGTRKVRSKPGRSAGHFAIRRQICGGPNRADLLVTLPSDGRSVEVSLSLTEGRSRAGTRKVRSKPGRSAGHFAIRRQICGGPNRADLLVTLPSDGRSVEVSLSLTEGRSRAGTRKVRSKPGRSAGHFAIRRQICGGPNRADLLVTLPSDGRSVEVSLSLTEGRSRAGTRKVRSKPGRSAGHFAIRRQICGGPNRADLLVTLPSDGRSVEVSLSLTEGRSRAGTRKVR